MIDKFALLVSHLSIIYVVYQVVKSENSKIKDRNRDE
ncbi:hypothetical protein MTsDn1_22260 [Alteromonas sp. MTD1]